MKRFVGIGLVGILVLVGLLSLVPDGVAKPRDVLAYSMGYYSSSEDGHIYSGDTVYATARGDGTTSGDSIDSGGSWVQAGQNKPGSVYNIYRGILYFDTSSLPDGSTITSAYINFLGDSWSGGSDTLYVVNADSVSRPAVVSDFGTLFSGTTKYGSKSSSSWVGGSSMNITLDYPGSDIDEYISRDGWTSFGLRSGNDINNTPALDANGIFYVASREYRSSILNVEYYYTPTVHTVQSFGTDIQDDQAVLRGSITDYGGVYCYRGFVWDTISRSDPTGNLPGNSGYTCPGIPSGYWTDSGTFGNGAFSHNITGLTAGITYYYRAFATSSGSSNYQYGDEYYFDTLSGAPTLTTGVANPVTRSTAVLNGTVTDDGGQDVTVYFEWGTTTAYGEITDVAGGWPTSSNPYCTLDSLVASTTYHFRLSGSNDGGSTTVHGLDASFITSGVSIPTVITDSASNVASTTVTLRGHITNDGGDKVKVRFGYSKDPNSTAEQTYTSWTGLSYATGEYFTADVTGLTIETLYYFRAEAEHTADLGQGSILSFTTVFTAPTNFTAKVSGQTVVNLSWTPQGDKTDVYCTTSDFLDERNMSYRIYYGTSQSYSVSSLDEGTTYYFTAWSWKSDDNTWSATSSKDAATTGSTTLTPMPSIEDVEDMLPDTPDTPTEWFQSPSGSNLSNWPFYTVVENTAKASGVPSGSMWFTVGIIIVVVIGIVVWTLGGSVFWILIGEGVGMAFLSKAHILPMWILLAYIIIGGSMAYLMKREA